MKKILMPALLAFLTLIQQPAGAWGFFGHRVITQVAVYELPSSMQPFYYRHMAELVRQSTAPDERRNSDPTEGPKHFIDMDHYSEDNPFAKVPRQYDQAVEKFSLDTLKKYGTVPWVILETKDNLVEAFKQRDTVAIIKYSAELGHYTGDAFVPLHTTINYDGQLSDQKGLHSLWESQLPEKYINDYHLDGAPAAAIKDELTAVWAVIQASYGFLGETFDQASRIEKTMKPEARYSFSYRYGKAQRRFSDAFAAAYELKVGGQVAFRLKGATTTVASLWLTAWQEAGKPDLNSMMTPPKPTKEEKEKLTTELTAWKKNTLPEEQLLLAQQKVKKVETVDEIKSAQDMPPPPVIEPEPAPAPAAATETPPAPTPAPADKAGPEKVKVKIKEAGGGKQKTKATKSSNDGWGNGGSGW